MLKYSITMACMVISFSFYARASYQEPDTLSTGRSLPTTLRFKNYNMSNGLPGGFVIAIAQDQNGLMWFGDEGEGLVSFDGRNFELFSHDFEDSTSLSSDNILCIQADAQNNLWIGTDHGLNRKQVDPANYKTNSFEKFFASSEATDLPDNQITNLFLAANSDLLVGTVKGLCVYRGKRIFEPISLGIDDALEIRAICQASSGNIYVGTNQGLFLLDAHYNLLSHWNQTSKKTSIDVSAVIEGPDKRIWISTGELYLLDPEMQTIESINAYADPDKPFSVRGINNLMLDNLGRVWIGTISSGAFVCTVKRSGYEFIDFQNLLAGGFQGDQIRAIFEDRMGMVWLAAKSKGLNMYDSKSEHVEMIVPFRTPPSQSSDNSILALAEDEEGHVYFGSRSSGLAMYDRETRNFRNFEMEDGSTLSTDRVQAIAVKSKDEILIGTTAGVSLFHPSTSTFTHNKLSPVRSLAIDKKGIIWAGTSDGLLYLKDIKSIAEPFNNGNQAYPGDVPVAVVYVDKAQNLWIGTQDHGLIKHDLQNNQTEWINNLSLKNKKRFPVKHIRSITEDANGNIWIGTRQSGLYMFKKGENNFEHYPYKMFQGSIRGMAVDERNNLWLVTHRNIFQFAPDKGELSKFGKEYGLYGIHTVLKTREGLLLFGGDHRVLSHDPQKKLKNRPPSKVSIKSVTRPLRPIEIKAEVDDYRYSYREPLTFDFFIDDFSSPTENTYSYKLTDVDDQWTQPGPNHRVSYANLRPGEYSFMVKGADATGTWAKNVASIDFTVLPPWWLTTWAKAGYFLVAVFLGYIIYQILAFRFRKRRELKKLKYEKEQSEILTQHKLRFFTNISHELRTPLTLMIPSAEKISESQSLSQEELRKHGNIINRSANTLFSLVDELIQFKRIEEGAQQFAPGKTNIAKLCSRIFDDLDPAAAEKNIDYDLNMEGIENELWIDRKILEKVLRNLIFNAIKYTPNSGCVKVSVCLEKAVLTGNSENLRIDVIDNGIGISNDDKAHIFDRFYRTEQGSGFASGAGIGLDLVKNLVALHQGTIEVESNEGTGSHFIVNLPVQEPILYPIDLEPSLDKTTETEIESQEGIHEPAEDHILIVEDDAEISAMLKELFSESHKITVAKNGVEGVERAMEFPQPNLIISDVLMPEMNGYELCAEIKKNFKTSHIPVLLLTAKSGISDELEGLQTGANAYVTKPFYPKVLLAKVDSLLKNQKLLKERFARDAQLNPSEIDIPDPDKLLLTSCVKIIEENMQDEQFSVENLAREVGMSRTQLFRKLKYLVGVSASELIYSIRLKRASKLLKSEKLTIAEVAHMTGFSTPSSFSNTFKKHFKISPREFIENNCR